MGPLVLNGGTFFTGRVKVPFTSYIYKIFAHSLSRISPQKNISKYVFSNCPDLLSMGVFALYMKQAGLCRHFVSCRHF